MLLIIVPVKLVLAEQLLAHVRWVLLIVFVPVLLNQPEAISPNILMRLQANALAELTMIHRENQSA